MPCRTLRRQLPCPSKLFDRPVASGGQAAQGPQVNRVHRAAVGVLLGRFQNHGPGAEARVVDQKAERLQAQAAAADGGMAVYPAAARLETVIEVKQPKPAQADDPLKL